MVRESNNYILREIKIEVTHRCPLVCLHCSSEATPGCDREMSFAAAMGLLNQVMDYGVEEIVFSGGEPLIWKGIEKAILACTKAGIRTLVYTSGNFANQAEVFKKLKDVGVSQIAFSIFGGDAEKHERVTRRYGSFSKTLKATEEAFNNSIEFEFHFVPLSINYEDLPGVVSLASGVEAKRVSILRFVPQGRGAISSTMGLTREQNIELKRLIENGRKSFDIRAGSPYNFLLVNESPKCLAGIDRLIVGPEFSIYPCDAFKQLEALDMVGTDEYSRLDKYSLIDCWDKSFYFKEIREYLSTPFEKPCCDCYLLKRCLSGCLAQKVIASGSLKKAPDPMCLSIN